MAIEPRRGCGHRKVGGLYMMGGSQGIACCKMPIPLHICPTCNQGVKQTRGWQWIDPKPWVSNRLCITVSGICPLAEPESLGDRVGLLWVGTQFYPTPGDFIKEADALGISRRIKSVPHGFELGKTWVFLAHPHVIHEHRREAAEDGQLLDIMVSQPGIFRVFKPTHIEKIVTQTQSEDEEEMEKLRKRGITPFVVPDDDRDHQGSVYDKSEPETAQQEIIL